MLLRDQMGELLTVNEVMATLKIGRSTLYKLVRNGQLELLKMSHTKSLITERSLERFLSKLTEGNTKEGHHDE